MHIPRGKQLNVMNGDKVSAGDQADLGNTGLT